MVKIGNAKNEIFTEMMLEFLADYVPESRSAMNACNSMVSQFTDLPAMMVSLRVNQ